jgi:cell fate regulator YaaT (PSP1 superfamily)
MCNRRSQFFSSVCVYFRTKKIHVHLPFNYTHRSIGMKMTTYSRGCSGILTGSVYNSQKACSCNCLEVYDWLSDIKNICYNNDVVEVRFKNTRKGFYKNVNKLMLEQGDVVAVESSPGHDLGIISLRGELVREQMIKYKVSPSDENLKKIYRKAKPADMDKWEEAISMEIPTMLRARGITESLNLNMKIGDVEYQGDKTKAIFYYISEERVDFRELIKVLADEFRVRIEMRQVGARQEAGRIGGIGICGRQLCCSSWLTNFKSVTTNAARVQEISLNPQKLAGQCSKLKCCINYEVEVYNDAKKDFPDVNQVLETMEGNYFFQKADIFKKIVWYSDSPDSALNMISMSLERVKEIIALNRSGKKPPRIVEQVDIAGEEERINDFFISDSISRFDEKGAGGGKKRKKNRKKKNKFKRPENGGRNL